MHDEKQRKVRHRSGVDNMGHKRKDKSWDLSPDFAGQVDVQFGRVPSFVWLALFPPRRITDP
jgi:hypothetical protein